MSYADFFRKMALWGLPRPDANGGLTAQVGHRTGPLNALLAAADFIDGEIGVATDTDAIVVYRAGKSPVVYRTSSLVGECGVYVANTSVPAATWTPLKFQNFFAYYDTGGMFDPAVDPTRINLPPPPAGATSLLVRMSGTIMTASLPAGGAGAQIDFHIAPAATMTIPMFDLSTTVQTLQSGAVVATIPFDLHRVYSVAEYTSVNYLQFMVQHNWTGNNVSFYGDSVRVEVRTV